MRRLLWWWLKNEGVGYLKFAFEVFDIEPADITNTKSSEIKTEWSSTREDIVTSKLTEANIGTSVTDFLAL